ncbi:MAG TPA: hypothetical protein H9935_08230 [Candidatus Blautia merdigallinarum]|uniref:J domain-containing protein n=1 Tax=Candidatus Blautia merdigallinarum TaxID=2838495 RepID=A0A9D2N5J3_9FIRM|nr:hypothetical protein [Candidatus Blautia merdigallinarum]
MEKIDGRRILKIFLTVLKVIFAIPAAAVFILIRCIQYFLKISGTVVSFVCILSSVVVSLAALVEVALQIQGNGPGIAAIVLTLCVAGGLIYVPVAGVGLVMVVLEAACSWIWRFYMGSSKTWKAFYKRPDFQWSAFDSGYKGKDTEENDAGGHYFKGLKTEEELDKRYFALLRIYHPDDEQEEDEITRGIVEEYQYLKNKFTENHVS